MNKFLAIGLGAAAVVVIAVIAFNLLPGSTTPGGEPTVSPSVEPSSDASAPAGFVSGPHVVWEDAPEVGSITLTIPNGWALDTEHHVLEATDFENTAILVMVGDLYVYGDPCQWSTTLPDTPATTVEELIAALGSQASRDASEPADIGFENSASERYVGQSITLHVPDDAVFTDCDEDTFGTLTEPGFLDSPSRYQQGPGQIDEFLVVDVGGTPVAFDLTYWPDTPSGVIDEMRAIAESAEYGN